MIAKTQKLIEDRIRWKAKKHNLPGDNSAYIADLDLNIKKKIMEKLEETGRSKPVLAFFESENKWSVITTDSIVGYKDKEILMTYFNEILEIDGFKDAKKGKKKEELDTLVVIGKNKSCNYWAPKGGEFFALWNICSMLQNLLKTT